jgi:hypothetical protein
MTRKKTAFSKKQPQKRNFFTENRRVGLYHALYMILLPLGQYFTYYTEVVNILREPKNGCWT